jgi:hypothetical protein
MCYYVAAVVSLTCTDSNSTDQDLYHLVLSEGLLRLPMAIGINFQNDIQQLLKFVTPL